MRRRRQVLMPDPAAADTSWVTSNPTPVTAGTSSDRRTEGPDKVTCRTCSHPKDAHEHHRRGTDCSQSGCGCLQWRAPRLRLFRRA